VTGVPVPTIKFYIRQGLLPRGNRTAANQAQYDNTHVERLRLIRSLRDVADLPLAVIAEVVAALDEPEAAAQGQAVTAALRAVAAPEGEISESAERAVAELVARRGWAVEPDFASYRALASALTALESYWVRPFTEETLDRYAEVAERLAEFEIPEDWDPPAAGENAVAYAVLGTLLFEPIILAMRRLAHADRSIRLTRRAQDGSGS
jgi:DNA-binding transcriptional MerR regulator